MTTLQTLTISICIGLLSCNNYRTETAFNTNNAKVASASNNTALKSEQKSSAVISDTIKRFTVDDYPVTNAMLADKPGNNSSYKKQSGLTYSYDRAWFSNDTLQQTLVFELYTDYHRMVTYHFYNNDIPTDLMNRMELHFDGGGIVSEKQKLRDFSGFLKQAITISATYFITDKGFRLGDTKQKAINLYGTPEKVIVTNGIDKLEWNFAGDEIYDGKTNLKGKPLAKDSFGHQVIMYFRNEKLIGQILLNDIP